MLFLSRISEVAADGIELDRNGRENYCSWESI